MIGDHDHALGEGKFHQTILRLSDLVGYRGIAADAYRGRTPPVGHGGDEQAEGLLGEGHVGIVELAVDPVEGCADKLGCVDTVVPSSMSVMVYRVLVGRKIEIGGGVDRWEVGGGMLGGGMWEVGGAYAVAPARK
jgi:hypothetical protein